MRRPARWIWGAAAVAALAGCASLPTSGSVRLGRALPVVGAVDNPNVRAIPSGPFPGLAPAGLVTGYLDALVDSDNNYAIARSFLAPDVSWNSTSGITLYDENSLVVSFEGAGRVEVSVARVGEIDGRGSYRVAPGAVHAQFRVVRHAGEWRISHLPAGVLLSSSDARTSLLAASIYEFNRAQTRLVPVPILVPPDQPGLATTLIRALLDGPTRPIAPAVLSAIPNGTELVGNVPVDRHGVAEVNLTGAVQQASGANLQRLSAQVLWTLRQVPSVAAVRLLDNGVPLTNDIVPSFQAIDSLAQFDPDPPLAISGALFSGRHGIVGRGRPAPVSLSGRSLDSPAVSADGSMVAAIRVGRRPTLLVGSASGPLQPRLTGAKLSAPSFDPAGDVFVADGSVTHTIILEVPRVGAVRQVRLPAQLRDRDVSTLAVSRDGSRVAMTVGPAGDRSLVIAALGVVRGTPTISGAAVVIPATRDVSGAAWALSNRVVTTGRVIGSRRAVIEVSIDGYRPHLVTIPGLPGDPVQVAAAPDQPLLATAGGSIWSLSDHRWQLLSPGSDPSYSG